ncbi:hypothetical protein ROZALSC1DRAFT_24777, partial [Rozella allomycis CSF55]
MANIDGRVHKRNLGDIQLKIQEAEANLSNGTINFISYQILQFISMLKLHEELQTLILNMDSDQEKNFPWFLLKINSSSLEDLTVKNVRKSICRRIHDWSVITIPHISPAFSQSTSIIKRLYQVIWDKKRPVQHQILYWKIMAN